MILFSLYISCNNPCQRPLNNGSTLVDIFKHIEENKCLNPQDIDLIDERMTEHHRKTTLHCDTVYRRSSIDGKLFDGPQERWLDSASVADVFIDIDGTHYVVFNDLRTGLLSKTAELSIESFWQQGLVGYGGLGLVVEHPGDESPTRLLTDLRLKTPQEVVDPDIRKSRDGLWKLVWFGVDPSEMHPSMPGPLSSPKPHKFYQSHSRDLTKFSKPEVIIRSTQGSTGGSDPAVLELEDGSDVFLLGPLDLTTMAWFKDAKDDWNPDAGPTSNTLLQFATPDALVDPKGGYRLYGMKNGEPGSFWMATSSSGKRWSNPTQVLEEKGAFNISVGVDPIGTWWIYYNMTDPDCLAEWGSQKVLPPPPIGERLRPPPKL